MARHQIICLSCAHRSLKLLNDSTFVPPAAIYSLFHGFSSIRTWYGCCTFAVAGPTTWNLFQNNLHEPDMQTDCFCHTLKTFFNSTRHIERIRGVIFGDDVLYKLTMTFTTEVTATQRI